MKNSVTIDRSKNVPNLFFLLNTELWMPILVQIVFVTRFPSLVSRVFSPPFLFENGVKAVCASSGRSALLWHRPLSSKRKKKCNHITKEPFFRQHNKKTLAFFHHSFSCEKKSCFAFFAKSAWFDTSTSTTRKKTR